MKKIIEQRLITFNFTKRASCYPDRNGSWRCSIGLIANAALQADPTLAERPELRPDQIAAINAGKAKIPDLTWHHHQDAGRMQLVNEDLHAEVSHVGGGAMSDGQ